MNIHYLIGGTTDITAHEIMEDGNVKELIRATGENWGGSMDDGEYMDVIKCLIGQTWRIRTKRIL